MKYQTGIQNTVLQIIKKSDKLGLPYITKDQIVDEITRYMDLNNLSTTERRKICQKKN